MRLVKDSIINEAEKMYLCLPLVDPAKSLLLKLPRVELMSNEVEDA